MKQILLACLLLSAYCPLPTLASGDVHATNDKNEIRYITDNKRMPDAELQTELRNKANWQNFVQQNGTWYVIFNEENSRPHRAFGKPIPAFGVDGKSRALNFIGSHLQAFNIPAAELNFVSAQKSENYEYVNFTQVHNGLNVLNSRFTVKLTHSGSVVLFGADVFTDITVSTNPSISESEALIKAKENLEGTITNIVSGNELSILPVPQFKRNVYKLVYEFLIETTDASGTPAKYKTLVDAATGEVVMRKNLVSHFHPTPGGAEANVTGTLYTTHNYNPSSVNPLVNLKVTQGVNVSYTDASGNVTGLNTGTTTFELEGLWSSVRTNGVTPSFDATLVNGANAISFDSDANIRELSAYYHVNIVHDYMKTFYTSFTDMDNALETNVDLTTDNCNAFYDGSSINFYAAANGCASFAQIGDVVYHEYGHGINDKYYQSIGAFFQNGAMGEGYADVWALGITQTGVLGIGNSSTDATSFIRRYDQEPMVYPQDISGEVHNDGEIIAGAWWDLGVNLGNVQQMMALYAETFNGAITGPDGDEGQVYVDILIEALTTDDAVGNGGDNDITNGTPNDLDIVNAFDRHGITLLSNATLNHNAITANNGSTPIDINATISLQYPWALENALLFYKVNRNGAWTSAPLANTGGNNYTAQIPAQSLGTLIAYYLALENLNGVLSSVLPIAAEVDPYPNTPYFILNGFKLEHTEDFDNTQGDWTEGLNSDNNGTGSWVIDVPIGSFSDGNIVQTDEQTTPGGIACALTGNASSTSAGVGESDVDDGHTTLVSPVFDLTGYTNPLFSFMKWYTNNPPTGANPRADWWQVQVTDDGTNWEYVENTLAGERNWRRYAFRVSDYVNLTSNFQVRFIASDSTRVGQELDGGSLIEAAIDDLKLYEEGIDDTDIEENNVSRFNVYPVPAKENITISFELKQSENLTIQLFCSDGQLVKSINEGKLSSGFQKYTLDVSKLSAGVYFLNLKSGENAVTRKVTVVK
jgi:Zn-dependent metalloprotease